MSVINKIEEIKTDIANAYEAVANKGGSIPSISGSANLAQAIASIPEGGAPSELEYEWWSPKMTSDTTPEPYVASADSFLNDSYPAFKVFDGNTDGLSSWASTNGNTHWIQIDIGESKNVAIAGLSLFAQVGRTNRFPLVFDIQGSNDGFVWKDILKVDEKNNPIQEEETSREYYFKESHYRYYKLYITDWEEKREGGEKISLSEILFYRAIGNSYAVTSFNGRTGDILPQDGDYSAENISFSSDTLEATNVKEAIEELASNPKEETQSTFLVKAPVGTIVIWSGTEADIPKGWELCDGTNGTPNLKDKFVLGAGDKHPVGDEAGEEEVTLTVEQMPEHNHTIPNSYGSELGLNTTNNNIIGYPPQTSGTYSSYNVGTVSSRYAGSSQPHNNMPPYYALCYIMKVTPDDTDISAEDVTFEPGETGLEATNVQQAIEELAGRSWGSSSSGITNWDDINGRPTFSNVSRRDVQTVVLKADGWDEDNKQSAAALTVLEDETKQQIIPVPTEDSYDPYYDSNIIITGQGKGEVYFKADSKPNEDVNVLLFIEETVNVSKAYNGRWIWWSPKMTSNTTPEPYVVKNSTNPSNTPDDLYKWFDGDINNDGEFSRYYPYQIDIGSEVYISGFRYYSYGDKGPRVFSIEASNNETDWNEIFHSTGTEYKDQDNNNWYDFFFDIVHYRYYRFVTSSVWVTGSTIRIRDIEFYKWEEDEK